MDNCIHGVDARNPCKPCSAVASLSSRERAVLEKSALSIVTRMQSAWRQDAELFVLGELALAFSAGARSSRLVVG